MRGEEFLDLAEKLANEPHSPALTRCVIGRAYYGAFNVAAELLRAAGRSIPDNPGAHGLVRDFLLSVRCEEALPRAGTIIGGMKSARNRADYQLNDTGVENYKKAHLYLADARRQVIALRAAFGGPQRDMIITELQTYALKTNR